MYKINNLQGYVVQHGIEPIFYNNYKWSMTFKNCCTLCCTITMLYTYKLYNIVYQLYLNLKKNNSYLRILYLAKLSFTPEGEIKAFPDKQKLREFITTSPTLHEILKGALLRETKRQNYTKLLVK